MSTTAQLLAAQMALAGLIERSTINFNKLAKERQTLATVRNRLDTLRGYWEKFLGQHAALEAAVCEDDELRKNMYFSNDVFVTVSNFYDEGSDLYHELIAKLSRQTPTATASSSNNFEVEVTRICP